jgi:hypothetical protein
MTDQPVRDATTSPSRRTVLRAAAWSAPAIALAVAAPAAAASTPVVNPASAANLYVVVNTMRSGYTWDGSGNRIGVTSAVQLENRWDSGLELLRSATVIVEFPSAFIAQTTPVINHGGSTSTGAWVAGTPTTSGDVVKFPFTFTASSGEIHSSGNTGELEFFVAAVGGKIPSGTPSWDADFIFTAPRARTFDWKRSTQSNPATWPQTVS